MGGDASETYHVYYPADVNNDGRYDLLRLNANADVPNPKTFFTLSPDGQSISAKYEVIPLDEYLKRRIKVRTEIFRVHLPPCRVWEYGVRQYMRNQQA